MSRIYEDILEVLLKHALFSKEYVNPNFLLEITRALEDYADLEDDIVDKWVSDLSSKEDAEVEDILPPCPACGSEVEITNSRDCNVLTSYVQCQDDLCGGTYFSTESQAFSGVVAGLGVSDFEIVRAKYTAWLQNANEATIKGYRCSGEWE